MKGRGLVLMLDCSLCLKAATEVRFSYHLTNHSICEEPTEGRMYNRDVIWLEWSVD